MVCEVRTTSNGETPGDGGMSAAAREEAAVAEAPADPIDALDSSSAGGLVIRGSVFRGASYAAGVSLSVLSAALMIRHLGVTDWGRYVTVSSLIAVATGLSEAGTSNVGIREYATLDGGVRNRLLRNLLGIRLVLTLFGVAAATVFAAAAGYPAVVVLGTLLAGVGLVLAVAQQVASIPLIGTLRFGWVSLLDFVRQAAVVAGVVALVAAGAGLLPFFAVPIPVGVLVLALTIALLRKVAPVVPLFERAEWRRILKLTVVYAVASAVGTIYVSVTVIVTSLVGTAQETGYYGASFRIFTVVGLIPLLLVGAAFPVLARAARDDRDRLHYALGRVWEMALILGVWIGLMLAAAAPFAIRVVAGKGFEPAVPVLRIQAGAIVGGFLAVSLAYVLLSVHRHAALLVANSIALGGSLLLTFLLVPSYGAKGAAVATVVGEFGLAAAYLVGVVRAGLRVPWRGLPAIALGVAAVSAIGVLTGLDGLPLALVAAVLYPAVLLALRAVPPEVFDALGWRSFGPRPR
jgi:O-antigen/teichoic acid export membrane protein